MSEDHVPLLSDFGLSRVMSDVVRDYPSWLSADTTTGDRGGALRWLATELLGLEDDDDENGKRPLLTLQTDIYSLAMVVIEVRLSWWTPFTTSADATYQIFTANIPFATMSDMAVFKALVKGKRPLRPECEGQGMNDTIWALTVRSWGPEPTTRPTAAEFVATVKAASYCSRL